MQLDRRSDETLARMIDYAISLEASSGSVRVWAALDRLGLPADEIQRLMAINGDEGRRRAICGPCVAEPVPLLHPLS